MKEDICKILRESDSIHLSFYDIKRMLHLNKKNINDEIKASLDELELEGVIFCDENNIYHKFPSKYKIATIHKSKYGKYNANYKGQTYAIELEDVNGALSEDIAVIYPVSKKKCKVIKVVKRNHNTLVCEVKLNELMKKVVVPYNVNQMFNVSIGYNALKKLAVGTRILVDLSKEKFDDLQEAEFVEIIGHKDDPDIDLECIAVSNGFKTYFSDEVLDEAYDMPCEVTKEDFVGRVDLTNEEIFTIDGVDTKDMDDAISCKKLDNGNYLLSVHIAHVSHYIKAGTLLWDEAVERSNSLYQLDSVEPMLPHNISNGICSLNEGEDRLTRTVDMEINKFGEIVNYDIYKSVINSKKKMNYDDVNEYFETGRAPKGYEPFTNQLDVMRQLYYILDKKYKSNGYLNFDNSEIEFDVSEEGEILSHHLEDKGISQKLIEYFMISANTTVTEHVYWQDMPFTYRNHGLPNNSRLDEAIKTLKYLGYRLEKIDDVSNPKNIQNILNNLSNKENYPILSTFILRSMQRANYSTENIGHYGLSLGFYTHFTSPIRRIIDLTVHTLLDYYENTNNEMSEAVLTEITSELNYICAKANMQERNADIAEFESNQLALVKYYEDKIGEDFTMYVTEITPKYITVRSKDLVEGIIPLNDLDVKYNYNSKEKSVTVEGLNKKIILGSEIKTNLIDTSREYRELYFTFRHLWKELEKEKRLNLINN